MSDLPDPKKNWHSALLRIVVGEKSYYPHGDSAAMACSFGNVCSGLPAIGVAAGMSRSGPGVVLAYISVGAWLVAVYLCYWRLYTRPRMPTIWEALLGYVLVLFMWVPTCTRLLIGWVREAHREIEETDSK